MLNGLSLKGPNWSTRPSMDWMMHDSVGLKNLAIIWLYFCIHRYSDEIGEMPWHVVLISDRDLWLPLLWHDSIVGKQMSTFSAGLGSRCPFNCHQTTLPYNCIWFKSNNDTGVRSQYNCIWSGCLDTTPMLKPPHWFNDTQNIQTKTLLSPL